MVTREQLARIALAHDTSMAAALRRALGIRRRRPARRKGRRGGGRRRGSEYEGMAECFRNEGGVDPEAGA